MNLFAVSLRNVRVRLLSSVLTTVSIMIGTALLASLWLLREEIDRGYKASIGGYRAVVGSKDSSPLELTMSTVLNLGVPQGVVKLSTYTDLHEDRLPRRCHVRYAIPQARGDTYSRFHFPIIGTTDEMFSAFELGGKDQHLEFARGEAWRFGHQDLMRVAEQKAELAQHMAEHAGHGHEGHDHSINLPASWRRAVIGSKVARQLDLDLGAEIVPVHGRQDEVGSHTHDDFACAVSGVLAPTNTPIDRAVFIPLGTFLSMDDHVAVREAEGAEAGDVLLSAIVAKPRHHVGDRHLELLFQTRSDAQVAVPAKEIPRLMEWIGGAKQVLEIVSYLVLIVAAASVLVALYNTMNERRREIAIMRSLGARRPQIVRVILQEAALIALVGAALGVLLCHAAAWAFGGLVEDLAGVAVDWAAFSTAELWLILAVGALGGLAGILPAIKGSLTPVAEHLGPIS
ncbi:MAG: ABC transporter permease [Planctomycetota bacterium]